MIQFPSIPKVETGKALGATVLNSYHKALRYGMAQSHEPQVLQLSADGATYSANWQWLHTWFIPHFGNRISFRYRIRCSGGVYGSSVDLDLRVDVGGTEIVVYSDNTGSDKWMAVDSLDITGLGLNYGTTYAWKLYYKRSGSDDWVYCTFWELDEYDSSISSDWMAPPAFTENAISSAAYFNRIKDDLEILNYYRMDIPKGLMACPAGFSSNGSSSWITLGTFCYRYRPDKLRVNVWCNAMAGKQWGFLATAQRWGGAEFDIFGPQYQTQPGDDGIWGVEGNVDMTVHGLTRGEWLLIRIKVVGNPQLNLKLPGRCICERYSSGVPATGWQPLADWAEGDSNIGSTRLNKLSTDLNALYSGGVEALWGQMMGTGFSPSFRHVGCFIRRWLHYLPAAGQQTSIAYGPNLTRTISLGTGTNWQVFDLESTEIPIGSLFELNGCQTAFEFSKAEFHYGGTV